MPPEKQDESKRTQHRDEVTPEDLQRALDGIDWAGYWKRVIQKTSEEATQYERARAKSREVAAYHVMR